MPRRDDGAQPGISLVDGDVFVCGTPHVCFRYPTFPVPMLLWLLLIPCSFPRRNTAQQIIYIQLGSLTDFEISKTLPPHKTRLPPQIRRYNYCRDAGLRMQSNNTVCIFSKTSIELQAAVIALLDLGEWSEGMIRTRNRQTLGHGPSIFISEAKWRLRIARNVLSKVY